MIARLLPDPVTIRFPTVAGRFRVVAAWCATALAATACDSGRPATELLATAHQMGPVGYRDPAGALSPSGRRLAFSQGRRVLMRDLTDGSERAYGPAPSQVRYLTWLPGDSGVVVHERSFDRRRQDWFAYALDSGDKRALWGADGVREGVPPRSRLHELRWAPGGAWLVGIERAGTTSRVWRLGARGRSGRVIAEGTRLALPVVAPDGTVACIERAGSVQRLRYPCEDGPVDWMEGHQPYGHVAFSPAGDVVYYAAPGARGVLELWSRPVGGGPATRLASGERDVYGPAVAPDGAVVYKSQHYMVSLFTVPAAGGDPSPVTTFQSETPAWHPSGAELSFTFGRWRRASDDVNYPDIDQHIGVVETTAELPKHAPDRVVRRSYSEDQGMHWSPNGRWIAYHSHVDRTDDIYLVRAGGAAPGRSSPAAPRLISQDGNETGWPRWSPDGRWIAFPSYVREPSGARRSVLYVVPANQDTGKTGPQRQVEMGDFRHDALQAEWLPGAEQLVFEAAEGPGLKALYSVPRDGGAPQRFHEWESGQVHSGIAVSPGGEWVAYVGPGPQGFFQIHRVPVGGGRPPEQLTRDPVQKTQPAYHPAGDRLAYTAFTYEARFWRLPPPT